MFSLIMVVLFMSVGPALATLYVVDEQDWPTSSARLLIEPSSEWRDQGYDGAGWKPIWQRGTLSYSSAFARDGMSPVVAVYVEHFSYQEQGREAVSDLNFIFDELYWYERSSQSSEIGTENFSGQVRETVIRNKKGDERIVWNWYNVRGSKVFRRLHAKLANAVSTLFGKPDVTVYVISAPVGGDLEIEDVRDELRRFVDEMVPTIELSVEKAVAEPVSRSIQ